MKNIVMVFCALLFCGCAGRLGRNVAKFDKVETVQVNQLIGNNLTRTPFDQKVLYLNARCETKRDGEKKYYLFTELIAPPEFVIQSGDSLVLNIDNEVLAFAATNSPSFDGRKRFVTTFYPVQPDVLTKLAKAKTVSVRIKGTNALIDKKLSRRNFVLFRDFAERCSLPAKTQPAKAGG